jgi:hypothetical protein
MSKVERSMEIKAIVKALLEKHHELQQVPSKTSEIDSKVILMGHEIVKLL